MNFFFLFYHLFRTNHFSLSSIFLSFQYPYFLDNIHSKRKYRDWIKGTQKEVYPVSKGGGGGSITTISSPSKTKSPPTRSLIPYAKRNPAGSLDTPRFCCLLIPCFSCGFCLPFFFDMAHFLSGLACHGIH